MLSGVIMLAPWLARALAMDVNLLLGFGTSGYPGTAGLLALGACTLLVPLLRPQLLRRFLTEGVRQAVLVPVVIGVAGTTLWLVLYFFSGALPDLNRSFALAYLFVLVPLLAGTRYLITYRPSIKSIALLAGLAITYFGLGGPLPQFSGERTASWLDGVGRALTAFATSGTDWLTKLFQDPLAALSALLAVPAVAVISLAFVAAAWITHRLQRRYLSGMTSLLGRLVDNVIWIVGTHLVWLVILFALGLTDVPRWLPLATKVAMAAITVGRTVWPLLIGGPRISARHVADTNNPTEPKKLGGWGTRIRT